MSIELDELRQIVQSSELKYKELLDYKLRVEGLLEYKRDMIKKGAIEGTIENGAEIKINGKGYTIMRSIGANGGEGEYKAKSNNGKIITVIATKDDKDLYTFTKKDDTRIKCNRKTNPFLHPKK